MRESVCGTSRHVAALRISVAFGAKRTLSYASLAVLQRRTLHHEHHTNKNKNPPLGSSHAVTIAVTDDPMMLCSKPVLQRAAPDATSIACQVTVVTAPDLRQPQVYPSWRRDNDGELHHGRHLYNWPLILLYYFLFSCCAIGVNAETAMPSPGCTHGSMICRPGVTVASPWPSHCKPRNGFALSMANFE